MQYASCKRGFCPKRRQFYTFSDLESVFKRVPREVAWLALRKQVVEEWLVKGVLTMYDQHGNSEAFKMKVRVNQGSVLFVAIMETQILETMEGMHVYI